ncbi:DUF4235 domain-containing protein [Actinomadura rudentiformis]|uniref:DUF4235 domain-containing protein n=1 Tax=Actinomadura rudentiformis TaxID=359158 RepID=A0A6H9YWS6_9ACTN|nr:DUF4235 domain-containing protein [Actinomadura rudentiformis]KAB2346902.1 DUF4235 domain-containing protein [Actinomadura rudentiformis]
MKIIYKVLSLLFSVLGGLLAGVLFKQAWKLAAGEDDAPDADDPDRSWREVLIAAAIQGAIFALVKAATQRAGAQAVRRTTGRWPADED